MGSRVGPPTRITASTSAAVMPRALQRLVADLEGALHQVHHHPVELVGARGVPARSITLPLASWQMLSRRGSPRCRSGRTSIFACSAASFEHLQAVLVLAQIEPGPGQEVLGQPGHDPVVEVVAAEVGVAGGREHLEDVLADLEDRDVEGAAAEVVDHHPLA